MYSLSGISTTLQVRNAKTLLSDVKGALESGDRDGAALTIHRGHSVIGGRAVATVLADVVAGRIDLSLSHQEAGDALAELQRRLQSSRLVPTGWFVLENLARAVGCFAASAPFGTGARALITAQRPKSDRQRTQLFLTHLHSRDVESAIQTWHTRVPAAHT
ncbi:MAG: hypothetical protein WD400_02595, partial [Pontimonas sp.]